VIVPSTGGSPRTIALMAGSRYEAPARGRSSAIMLVELAMSAKTTVTHLRPIVGRGPSSAEGAAAEGGSVVVGCRDGGGTATQNRAARELTKPHLGRQTTQAHRTRGTSGRRSKSQICAACIATAVSCSKRGRVAASRTRTYAQERRRVTTGCRSCCRRDGCKGKRSGVTIKVDFACVEKQVIFWAETFDDLKKIRLGAFVCGCRSGKEARRCGCAPVGDCDNAELERGSRTHVMQHGRRMYTLSYR